MKRIAIALFVLVLSAAVSSLGFAAASHTFKSMLSGREDVPAMKTAARGSGMFKLAKDGSGLVYTLEVKGIKGVTAAHIHKGMKGENGGPVATLYAGPEKQGTYSGVLAKGAIKDKDLVGALAGKTIGDLVKMIESGDAYVNVHTEKHPDGEIRGQIK